MKKFLMINIASKKDNKKDALWAYITQIQCVMVDTKDEQIRFEMLKVILDVLKMIQSSA